MNRGKWHFLSHLRQRCVLLTRCATLGYMRPVDILHPHTLTWASIPGRVVWSKSSRCACGPGNNRKTKSHALSRVSQVPSPGRLLHPAFCDAVVTRLFSHLPRSRFMTFLQARPAIHFFIFRSLFWIWGIGLSVCTARPLPVRHTYTDEGSATRWCVENGARQSSEWSK